MQSDSRPAFYALRQGAWRDYVTLLHIPYTLWHLSYVVLGAAAAPELHLDRMGWTLAAFFLAVGVGAHVLDELNGRPLKTRIPKAVLSALAIVSTAIAVGIGIVGAITVSPSLWGCIVCGSFILVAYNLELFRGRFHSDFWFALAWGTFPFVTSYWASAMSFSAGAGVLGVACFGLSLAQRKLSTQARSIRRRALRAGGVIEYKDGTVQLLGVTSLLEVPELVLRILAVSTVLLAVGWLALRL